MDNDFDVIILGTGLSESITAAALAKAGLKVAHIDPNPYYGANEATLTLDELVRWAETRKTDSTAFAQYRVDYLSTAPVPHAKQYSISLSPSVIPSIGPFISSLISSGVARYGSYKLLGPVAIYRHSEIQGVPQNKESIFQDKTIPLVEKRRLMRFLMFASGEFEDSPELQGKEDVPFDQFLRQSFNLSEEIAQVIIFALSYCEFFGESTLTALQRVRSSLRSAGRYGSSPFLVGFYGGSGELCQGFCRAAAVNGGVYILGRRIVDITDRTQEAETRFSLELEDIPDLLRSKFVFSSPNYLPERLMSQAHFIPSGLGRRAQAVARCIAIVDGTLSPPLLSGMDTVTISEGQSDSFFVVFPPGSLSGGSTTSAVHVLTAGAGTMSAPSEKSIIYLSMPLDDSNKSSKELLHPYLEAILESNPTNKSIFQLFYTQCLPSIDGRQIQEGVPGCLVLPNLYPDIFQSVDQATKDAESAFWYITQAVGAGKTVDRTKGIWMGEGQDGTNPVGYESE